MHSEPTTLLKRTSDLLILKCFVAGEMNGVGISPRGRLITGGPCIVKPDPLFLALDRMEEEGRRISSFWGDFENNRRAKYHRFPRAGGKQLEAETNRWTRISGVMAQGFETS